MISLRKEIRDALDDLIPPDPSLEDEVTTFVLASNRQRKMLGRRSGRSRWTYRFQGMAAVLAAALVILLIAGLIVGGRLLRESHTTPVPAIPQGELHKLEVRPLVQMQPMPSDGVCPIGPLATDFIGGPAIGSGTVRSIIGGTPTVYNSDWGTWNLTAFVMRPNETGLFLVRARDMQSGATAYFAGNLTGVADANVGKAVLEGKIAGQDRVNGQVVPLRPELVLNASAPSDFAKSKKAPTWVAFIGYPKAAGGCIFYQVDYGHSTETFVRGY